MYRCCWVQTIKVSAQRERKCGRESQWWSASARSRRHSPHIPTQAADNQSTDVARIRCACTQARLGDHRISPHHWHQKHCMGQALHGLRASSIQPQHKVSNSCFNRPAPWVPAMPPALLLLTTPLPIHHQGSRNKLSSTKVACKAITQRYVLADTTVTFVMPAAH